MFYKKSFSLAVQSTDSEEWKKYQYQNEEERKVAVGTGKTCNFYKIKHNCGHEIEYFMLGTIKEREAEYKILQEKDCYHCVNSKNIKKSIEEKLPKLNGSEKQINWAIAIRNEKLEQIKNNFNLKEKQISENINFIKSITDAKFFIENRFENFEKFYISNDKQGNK